MRVEGKMRFSSPRALSFNPDEAKSMRFSSHAPHPPPAFESSPWDMSDMDVFLQ